MGMSRELERTLGMRFRDPALLRLALTHRSHAFEAGGLPTNERLEFLGDSVLGLVVTDRIFRSLPEAPEGRLAKIRAAAVNTRSLADVARGLGVGAEVLLGRGEELSGGRDKDSILADTLEAIIGAAYLDGGMDVAMDLVERLFRDLLSEIVDRRGSLDHKTSLQELAAAGVGSVPVYAVTDEGPDHNKAFTAQVEIDGQELGRGVGRSKKEAEQAAARLAYAVLLERLAVTSATAAADDGLAPP